MKTEENKHEAQELHPQPATSTISISKHETREEHPLPALLTHWVHLVAMVVLIFTGFFIHTPFYAGSMAVNKTFHSIFAFILIATGVIRIYWAFFGSGSATLRSRRKIPDYKFFFPQEENRGKTLEMIKYYLFLRKTHPRTAKYNPLQKGAYVFLIVLILIQITTGFALYPATAGFLLPLTYFLGGPAIVRGIHYIVMWGFISITMVHIYLVLVESIHEIPLMFWWRESKGMAERYGLSEKSSKEKL